ALGVLGTGRTFFFRSFGRALAGASVSLQTGFGADRRRLTVRRRFFSRFAAGVRFVGRILFCRLGPLQSLARQLQVEMSVDEQLRIRIGMTEAFLIETNRTLEQGRISAARLLKNGI